MKRSCLLGVPCLCALLLPVAAGAAPLSPPDYQTSFSLSSFGDNFASSDTGAISLDHTVNSTDSLNHPGSATGKLDVKTTPFPSINISTSASGGGNAAVSENITYRFRLEDASGVYDPNNRTIAKTIVSYKGSASSDPGGFASAFFNINGDNVSEFYKVVTGPFAGGTHTIGNSSPDPAFQNATSFDETKTYDMIVNQIYRIDIEASAGNQSTGSSLAYLDPFFQLDPSESGKGYKLVFSPGIDNIVANTPIPPSLLMFGTALLGLGGLGYSARRKNKLASLALA